MKAGFLILSFVGAGFIFVAAQEAYCQGCAPVPEGLVSWWRAEHTALDEYGTNQPQAGGTLGYAAGEVGQAFSFDGVNGYIQVPASGSLDLGKGAGLTLEAWIMPQSGASMPIFDWSTYALWGVLLWVNQEGPGILYASLPDSTDLHIFRTSPGLVPTNVFTHVALTYDKGSGVAQLYVNGAVAFTQTLGTLTPETRNDLCIGYHRPEAPYGVFYYQGLIDEPSVYSRALSAAEIHAIYAAGASGKCSTPVPPSIIAQPEDRSSVIGSPVSFNVVATGTPPLSYQWRKDTVPIEGATNAFYTIPTARTNDAGLYSVVVSNAQGWVVSSNALLTVYAAPPCMPVPPGLTSWWRGEANTFDEVGPNRPRASGALAYASGKVGQAFSYDGLSSYLQVSAAPSLDVGKGPGLTLEAWVMPQSLTSQPIFDWSTPGSWGAMLWVNQEGPGILYAALPDSTDLHLMRTPQGMVPTNVFTHVALTYDKASGAAQLYVNGAVALTQNFGTFTPETSHDLGLGYRFPMAGYGAFYYQGLIDEPSVYSRALSAAEIRGIYDAGVAGKCSTPTPPSILSQPIGQTSFVGSDVSFSVSAVGSPPLVFQWTFNGTNLEGATAPILTLTNVVMEQAGFYSVQVTNLFGSMTSSNAELKLSLLAPSITSQPQNQTVTVGTTATFSVRISGSPPLTYQWTRDGSPIGGATNSVLVLTNASFDQMGTYAVAVTNAAGWAVSSGATLTVNYPVARIQLSNTTAAAGCPVVIPVTLIANGNENGLGFSLNFNPALLTYTNISVGPGAEGATLIVNDTQLSSGRVGALLALGAGQTIKPGAQQVCLITFVAKVVMTATVTPLSFGDAPITRQLADPTGHSLPATFSGGYVQISAAVWEADVSPRPNGDRFVNLSDWIMLGRYVAALDAPTNASEFQRADCAPRATMGDGAITLIDWVQAGRYAAGLDPLTVAGGPSSPTGNPSPSPAKDQSPRELRISEAILIQTQSCAVPISLASQGHENALSFSVTFDPTVLAYEKIVTGSAASNATLVVNDTQAGSGRIGVVLGLASGSSFSAGTGNVVSVSFRAAAAGAGSSALSFTDLPVRRQVCDTYASVLDTTYIGSIARVNPRPELSITARQKQAWISWPAWATNFNLEALEGPITSSAEWTNVSASPVLTNDSCLMSVPVGEGVKFYRLRGN